MSIKFAIKNTAGKAVKEGESFVRFSGTAEPYSQASERTASIVESDAQGNPTKWSFTTGLDEDKVEFYKWLSEEEKEVVKGSIQELKPLIEKYYGKSSINPDNFGFWKKRRDVNQLRITHEDIDVFYDTTKPEHALLYLSILAGAFSDVVAPNKDWAERFQLPHYLAMEMEADNDDGDEEISKADALAELTLLQREFGKDALYILAWCLQYDTNAFGAYNYSTSERDLKNYHIKYINGKLQTKGFRKPNYAKKFMEYVEKWRGTQTRPLLYAEAYVKAGVYFNFINEREKKFVTSDGTVLGNTVSDAVNNLLKTKFKVDFEALRTNVENKWKE